MRWLVLALLILLVACVPATEQVICTSPYIEHEGKCCMDVNENSVCDDSEETEEFEKVEEKVIETVKEEPKEEMKEEPETTTDETTEETPAEQPAEEPKRELPKTQLEELMAAYAQKVKSYTYWYESDKYLIRGDKTKVRLANVVKITNSDIAGKHYPLFYIDNVYLAEQKATGYCEGTDHQYGRQCAMLEIKDIPYDLYYKDYIHKTPADWLFEYYGKEPTRIEAGKYYIKGRQVTVAVWEEEGVETIMYFDERLGLPLRVEIGADPTKEVYDYGALAANIVREADVTHRNVGEIPAEEAFYSTLP